jgi:hypothetical protein
MSKILVLAGCFSLVSLAAPAQQVIHALVGTITSVDAMAKTIALDTGDGSQTFFKYPPDSKTSVVFDRNIRTDAAAAGEFQQSGARVIVYYFGDGDLRAAVAVRGLGTGPFNEIVGTVAEFQKDKHSLLIADKSRQVQTFKIASGTVVESGMGAAEGLRFQPQQGDQLRVLATVVNGAATALFINAL